MLWLNLSYERSSPLCCPTWQLPQIQPYHQKVVATSLQVFCELANFPKTMYYAAISTFTPWSYFPILWDSFPTTLLHFLFQHSCVLVWSLSPASASAQTLGFDADSGTPALPMFHITARHPHLCLALKINVLVLLWSLTLGFPDPDCDLLSILAAAWPNN